MISYVRGRFEQFDGTSAVVDVGGIGYAVNVTPSTAGRLPQRGQEIKLFTYMQVREDGISLHGFLTQEEVRLFILLISVSGIGAKVASAILSTLSPQQLMISIVADDAAALSKAPGVGRKTAQRIVLELRDKIKTDGNNFDEDISSSSFAAFESSGEKQDALDALQALGYGRAESLKAVLDSSQDGAGTEQIIRGALKKLGKNNFRQ